MKMSIFALALTALAGPALAQAPAMSPQHRSGGGAASQAQGHAQTPAGPAQPQGQMPMGQMMHGGGMTQGQGMQAAASQSDATKAYAAAVDKMHAPMAQAIQSPDPDTAFVKGMIPHHQSAIDMAKVVLQYGKDEQAKKWANDVIREQEREIAEMRAWLKAKGVE
ncbi:DUF305 domain-containing protein [Microvirga sp. GCM10011540]|uniref:CopM family metallochaperone n=1 Tax=Microvirga sp. GCM10011540 TaxID=3317338 RepID=UPI00361EF742